MDLIEEWMKSAKNMQALEEYRVKEYIGKGGFAYVYHIIRKIDEKSFAVKIYSKTDSKSSKKRTEGLRKESDILRSLRHPFILSFLEYKESSTHIFIIMEYCNGGDVLKFLARNSLRPANERFELDEVKIASVVRNILLALSFIHDQRKVHRDIKPENILLQVDYDTREIISAKIGDFGLCAQLDNPFVSQLKRRCGSWAYAAPELLKRENYSDVG